MATQDYCRLYRTASITQLSVLTFLLSGWLKIKLGANSVQDLLLAALGI